MLPPIGEGIGGCGGGVGGDGGCGGGAAGTPIASVLIITNNKEKR